MKKLLIILSGLLLTVPVLAASNNSTATQTYNHKHHKHQHKPRAKQRTNSASDQILDEVSSKKVATAKSTRKTSKKRRIARHNNYYSSINNTSQLRLHSYSSYVINPANNKVLLSKNADVQLPIASITKLMTAMVLLDSGDNLEDYIQITDADIDRLKNTFSRLKIGMQLRRRDLLLLALMSSENRASFALARTAYPGGLKEFIQRMNAKAVSLGMTNTQFYDPTGLTSHNKSTASDLAKMVKAAFNYDLIREDTTTRSADVMLSSGYVHKYINSDALVRTGSFPIELSKTGFTNEAGHCLVLYSMVNNTPVIMVFLRSIDKSGRLLDAIAVKNYVIWQYLL